MARKFVTNIDMVKNQILNLVLHLIGGDPDSPAEGQLWFNTSSKRLKYAEASRTVDVTQATTSAALFLYRNFS